LTDFDGALWGNGIGIEVRAFETLHDDRFSNLFR
jgi:hypothetical protein